MPDSDNTMPINPLPWVVWLLFLPIAGIELVALAGESGQIGGPAAVGWRIEMINRLALNPDMLGKMWASGDWPVDLLGRFVTYAFVHVSFLHAVMVCVFLLALGKMVAEVFRPAAVLAIFLAASSAGALAYSLVPGARIGLIGGYPAVYGLIGAFTYILWTRLGALHANQYRAFTLIGMLMALQLVFGLLFGAGWDWVAELVGFATGFALSFLLAPGGPGRALRRLRQR